MAHLDRDAFADRARRLDGDRQELLRRQGYLSGLDRRSRPHRQPGTFLRIDPAANQVRVQPVGQRDRRDRYAWLAARCNYRRLELRAMLPSAPTTTVASGDYLDSVHVSTERRVTGTRYSLAWVPPGKVTSPDAYGLPRRVSCLKAVAQRGASRPAWLLAQARLSAGLGGSLSTFAWKCATERNQCCKRPTQFPQIWILIHRRNKCLC